MTNALNGVCPLPHLGVIRVEGADARSFLQGQLTQDFALMARSQARLAAFCSAKGRVQASFIGLLAQDEAILLICSRDLLAATLKRLSMFVMRAKAKLTDATAAYALHGVAGNAFTTLAGGTSTPWACLDIAGGSLVSLYPALDQPRGLWVAPADTPAPAGDLLDPSVWLWGEVRSAVATVGAAVVDAFVPQMLNYESVGGVNFKKGCYPGQEVVARSQFRGTLKRRAYVAHAASEVTAGQEVFHSSDDSQPCGTVVQAAAAPEGGYDAIVSMQISAAADGSLTAAGPAGPALTLLPLPYLLMADV